MLYLLQISVPPSIIGLCRQKIVVFTVETGHVTSWKCSLYQVISWRKRYNITLVEYQNILSGCFYTPRDHNVKQCSISQYQTVISATCTFVMSAEWLYIDGRYIYKNESPVGDAHFSV
jgi:hypothetical protein